MNEKMNRIESLYNMLYKETDEIYGKLAHFFGMTSTAFWLLYFIREKTIARRAKSHPVSPYPSKR